MVFKEILPASLFKPTLPLSMGVRIPAGSDFIFLSGQTPRGDDGKTVCIGDARGQARQVFSRIKTLVEVEGATMANVCKLVIYLANEQDAAAVSEVRREFFEEPFPAVTGIVVRLYNPEWLVEIDATAVIPPK